MQVKAVMIRRVQILKGSYMVQLTNLGLAHRSQFIYIVELIVSLSVLEFTYSKLSSWAQSS